MTGAERESPYHRDLKLKLFKGPDENLWSHPKAALWRWRNNSGTWMY